MRIGFIEPIDTFNVGPLNIGFIKVRNATLWFGLFRDKIAVQIYDENIGEIFDDFTMLDDDYYEYMPINLHAYYDNFKKDLASPNKF